MRGLALRDLLQAAVDARGGASLRELESLVEDEERARPRGLSLNRTTASKILRGVYRGSSPGTVKAIAWLAGAPEYAVFAAAGLPQPRAPFADELPPDVDALGPREREAVTETVRVLLGRQQDLERLRGGYSATLLLAADTLRSIYAEIETSDPNTATRIAELARVLLDRRNRLWQPNAHGEVLKHQVVTRNAAIHADQRQSPTEAFQDSVVRNPDGATQATEGKGAADHPEPSTAAVDVEKESDPEAEAEARRRADDMF